MQELHLKTRQAIQVSQPSFVVVEAKRHDCEW